MWSFFSDKQKFRNKMMVFRCSMVIRQSVWKCKANKSNFCLSEKNDHTVSPYPWKFEVHSYSGTSLTRTRVLWEII